MVSLAFSRPRQLSLRLPTLNGVGLLTGVLYLVFFAFGFASFTDPDYWWHLRTGEIIVDTLSIPLHDTYSFTAAGAGLLNHQWLSEAFIYLSVSSFGYAVTLGLLIALTLASFGLMQRLLLRLGTPPMIALGLVGLGMLISSPFWTVRPQLLSWFLLAVFINVLIDRNRPAWMLVPVLVLWANLHLGFLLGLGIVGLWFLSRAWEARSGRIKFASWPAAAFVGAGTLLLRGGSELFPPVDAGQFTIYVRLPSGSRIERTEAVVADIEQVLIEEIGTPDSAYPEHENYPDSNLRILISNAGVLNDWPAAYTPNDGPMDAFIQVQLKNKKGMPGIFEYVQRLRDRLSGEFPGVDFAYNTGGMLTAALNFGLPSPIDIKVQGSDLHTLDEIARSIQQLAAAVPGAVDVRIGQRLDYPQLDIEVDRIKAALLGLTQEDVIKNVVTALNSSIGFDPAFWIDERNGNHYFIGAQYRESEITSVETLLNIPITGKNSVQPVSLRSLITVTRKTGPAAISHVNITRTVDIFANVKTGYDVGTVAEEIERRLIASPLLDLVRREGGRGEVYEVTAGQYAGRGYSVSVAGELQTIRDSMRQFAGGLGMAIVLIYLVMVALLRSFTVPLAILVSVPLGLVGVAILLYLTGTALSIPAAMGILMMSGIVVEFSIILLTFANQLVDEGRAVRDAVIEAVKVRFRPIVMTSMAAWLAMLPMAIGGPGAEANAPLARAIIGGVIAAAVLTLFAVPCFYVILKRENPQAVPAAEGGSA